LVEAFGLGVTVVWEEEENAAAVEAAVRVGFGVVVEFGVADHAAVAGIAGFVAAAGGLVEGLADVVEVFGVFQPHDVCFVGEIALGQ
jgi:hypothetical protein